jgi:hypothetical protein
MLYRTPQRTTSDVLGPPSFCEPVEHGGEGVKFRGYERMYLGRCKFLPNSAVRYVQRHAGGKVRLISDSGSDGPELGDDFHWISESVKILASYRRKKRAGDRFRLNGFRVSLRLVIPHCAVSGATQSNALDTRTRYPGFPNWVPTPIA